MQGQPQFHLNFNISIQKSSIGWGSRSFNNHDCSGTASQVTQQGSHQQENTFNCKVGFELAIDSIQFYVFINEFAGSFRNSFVNF